MIKFVVILSFVLTSMFARLNPFEPSDGSVGTTEELKPIPVSNLKSADDGTRTVKIITDEKGKKSEKVEKVEKKSPPKELKIVSFEKKQSKDLPIRHLEKETKELDTHKTDTHQTSHGEVKKNVAVKKHISVKKMRTKKVANKKQIVKTKHQKTSQKEQSKVVKHNPKIIHKEPNEVVVKADDVHKNENMVQIPPIENATRYNVLPLLAIDLLDKSLTIQTGGNYKIIKYFEDHATKKFVFDFKAKVVVSNTKENFKSPYFKSYTLGNHNEDGFFRVVIPATEELSNYTVEIKNNIGTIIHH